MRTACREYVQYSLSPSWSCPETSSQDQILLEPGHRLEGRNARAYSYKNRAEILSQAWLAVWNRFRSHLRRLPTWMPHDHQHVACMRPLNEDSKAAYGTSPIPYISSMSCTTPPYCGLAIVFILGDTLEPPTCCVICVRGCV